MLKLVAVNAQNLRIGEDHPRCRYTDAEVGLVIRLRGSGMSYGEIARKAEMPKSTVRDILLCRTRAQVVVNYRVVGGADTPGTGG